MVLLEKMQSNANNDDKDASNASVKENLQKPAAKKKFCNTVFAAKMRNRKKEAKLKNLNPEEVLTPCKAVSIDVKRIPPKVIPKAISEVDRKNRKRKKAQWKLGIMKKKKKTKKSSGKIEKERKDTVENANEKNADEKNIKKDSVSEKVVVTTKDNFSEKNIAENANTDYKSIEKTKINTFVRQEIIDEQESESTESKRRNQRKSLRSDPSIVEKMDTECLENIYSIKLDSCRRTIPFVGKLNTKAARAAFAEKIISGQAQPIEDDKQNDSLETNREINTSVANQPETETSKTNNTVSNEEDSKIQNTSKSKSKKSKSKLKNQDIIENLEKESTDKESNDSSEDIETKEVENCSRTLPFTSNHPDRKLAGKSGAPERPIILDGPTHFNKKSNTASHVQVKQTPTTNTQEVHSKIISMDSTSKKDNSDLKKIQISLDNGDKSLVVSSKDADEKLDSSNNIQSTAKISSTKATSKSNSFITKEADTSLNASGENIDNNSRYSNEDKKGAIKVLLEKVKHMSTEKSNTANTDSDNNASIEISKKTNTNIASKDVDVGKDDIEENSCSRTRPYIPKKRVDKKTTSSADVSVKVNDSNEAMRSSTDKNKSSFFEKEKDKPLVSKAKKSIEKIYKSNDEYIPTSQDKQSTNAGCDSTVTLDNSITPKFDSSINNEEWKFRRKRRINSESDAQLKQNKHMTTKRKKQSPKAEQSNSVPVSPSHTICSLFSINCTQHPDHHHHNSSCTKSLTSSKLKEIFVVLTKLENMKDPLVSKCFVKSESVTLSNNIKDLQPSQEIQSDNNNKVTPNTLLSFDMKSFILTENYEKSSLDQTSVDVQSKENRTNGSTLETFKASKRLSTDSTTSNDSINFSFKRRKRTVHYIESDSEDDVSQSVQLRVKPSSRPQLRERSRRSNVSNSERDEDDMEVAEFSRQGSLCFQNEYSINGDEDSDQEVSSATFKMRLRTREHEENSDREVSSAVRVTRAKSRAAGIVMDDLRDMDKKEKVRLKSVLDKKILKPTLLVKTKTPSSLELLEESTKPSSDTDELDEDHQTNNVQMVQKQELHIVEKLKTPITSQDKQDKSSDNQVGNEKSCTSRVLTPTKKSSHEQQSSLTSLSKTSDNASTIRKSRILNDEATMDTPKKLSETPNQRDRSVSDSRSDSSTRSTKKPRTNLFGKIRLPERGLESKKNAKLKDLKVQLIRLETISGDYKDLSVSEFEILENKYINFLMNSNFSCDWQIPINYHRPADTSTEPINNFDYVSDPSTQDDNQAIIEITKDTDDYQLPGITEKGIESPKKTPLKPDQHPVSSPRINLNDSSQFMDLQSLLEPVVIMHEGEAIPELIESTRSNKNLENQNDKSGEIGDQKQKQGDAKGKEKQAHPSSKDSSSTLSSTKIRDKEKTLLKKTRKKMMKCSTSNQCSVCKMEFDSQDVLYDHLYSHSEQELQSAFKAITHERNLNPNSTEDSDILPENVNENQNMKKTVDNIVSNIEKTSIDIEEVTVDDSNSTDTVTEKQMLNPTNPVNYMILEPRSINSAIDSQLPILICSCHAHETSGQDLQIEMVLFCKSCNIIFRRRDCFEVHFRTSVICRQKRQNNEITKTPKLFCSGCPAILNTLMDMRAHLEMHAKRNCQGTVTFVCNICKVAFFGVGGIFYSHWFNHTKTPNFVASKYSFPKLSVVSILEDSNIGMTQNKSQEGFFYIAEHVCRQCKLPFSSEPDLQKHKATPCQPSQQSSSRSEVSERNTQMIKLICDLCKKYYVNKEGFDRHCIERNHLKTPITKFSRVPVNETEQAIVCSLCRIMGKSIDEMKEHWKRVHSPIMELYTCKTCNVVPSNDVTNYTYDKFIQHCRLAHKSEVITCLVYFVTARYVCNICKFGFETEKSMKEHEVIHEKTPPVAANCSLPPNINDPMVNTLWIADKNVTSNSRPMHSLYIQYPPINGSVNVTLPQNTVALNSQNQQQMPMLNQSLNTMLNSTVGYVTVPNTNTIQAANSNKPNNLLRNLLATSAFNQVPVQQQQQQQQTTSRTSPEMIILDSRSNSPVMSNTAATSNKSAAEASAQRKSYMTMVNPDFEMILGSDDNQSSGSNDNASADKNKNSSNVAGDIDVQSNTDTLAPQPFEVVLVTDDVGDNTIDDTPIIDRAAGQDKSTLISEQQRQPTATPDSSNDGSSSTKSFLRVRSVAELQQIKLHLCSVCGMSFDTFQAFNQHQRVHDKDAGMSNVTTMELGRDAPVQMIPPMQNNGSGNESTLLTQLRHKIMVSSNGTKSPSNTNVIQNQSVITSQNQPHQQPPGYWFASCNGTSDLTQQPTMNYNTVNYTSVNRPPQQQQLQNICQPTQSNTATPPMNYSTRGPLPSHPNAAPSAMSPGRTGAIQLPERNTMNTNAPATKRPSGAATRIPQQSMLPSYETTIEQRQGGLSVSYNASTEDSAASSSATSSRFLPNILSRSHQQQINQYHGKVYNRPQNEESYVNSYSSSLNYSTQAQQQVQRHQQQIQIQQQQQPKVYMCKHPNCNFKTDNLSGFRNHEKAHPSLLVNQFVPQQQQQQHYQIQQQHQRLPVKHVSVCQMPERTRHAIPTSRSTTVSVQNLDKRVICRLCNFYFATSSELMEHNSIAHTQQVSNSQVCCYVCDYCSRPRIFETEAQLREHMNITHNFSCEFCKKRYPTRDDLQSHVSDAHKTT